MTGNRRQNRAMCDLFEARYAARLAAFQTVLNREKELRRELQELRDKARLSASSSLVMMRSMGADVVWQSWIEQRARELNVALAQVLIQKEQGMHFLRRDFGRKHASQELLRLEKADALHARNKHTQTELMTQFAHGSTAGRTKP